MSSARSEILRRVAAALRHVPQHETPADVAVARGYRTRSDLPRAELLAQFAERVAEYKVTVRQITPAELPSAIAAACAARGGALPGRTGRYSAPMTNCNQIRISLICAGICIGLAIRPASR